MGYVWKQSIINALLVTAASMVSTVYGFATPRGAPCLKLVRPQSQSHDDTTMITMAMSQSSDDEEESSSSQSSPFNFLKGVFSGENSAVKEKEEEKQRPVLPDVVIDPDFRLAGIFLVGGLVLDKIPYIQLILGLPITALGILFLIQTIRIRFVFDSDSFELKMGDVLDKTGENIIVGGENRWSYDSFVNYDFFPNDWIDQPQGPILVYFKETQTPSSKWNEGPGAKANSPQAIASGAKEGQVHFFPALCNCKQLKDEFEKRGCAKL